MLRQKKSPLIGEMSGCSQNTYTEDTQCQKIEQSLQDSEKKWELRIIGPAKLSFKQSQYTNIFFKYAVTNIIEDFLENKKA